MYKTLAALTLAAAAAAVPMPQTGSAIGAKPEQSDLFALAMDYKGTFVTLTAVSNGTVGNMVLSAGRPSVYPGTPAYFNGTGEYKALNFYVDDANFGGSSVYGLRAKQIPDGESYARSVDALFGFQEFEWTVSANGTIGHRETEALNRFYACEDTASKGDNIFLKWGEDTKDGKPPAGCVETFVIQDFDVPGGQHSGSS
ncbi:uncharacterized protein RCC_05621 [Ramularia collo-cygni]|uniref:Cell wall protein PhiA n=1 Tax=Ramularia collo-cygni TaxID=112498 RepID=A0A2D3V837_9PEZI|nr:uncharacterized protein RCC_05621 [Ramularia collo-cygni]CZT19766.1 uncharacterized protein RCC_05621 [Ramularia collo-cygni]